MGFIIALIVGGIIGWLASKVMNTDADQGIFLNVVVGCIGSLVGKFLYGLFVGNTAGLGLRDGIDIPSLIVAFVGTIVLLGIVNYFRRGKIR
ncbi:MAG: GlsB/YeaQ/YmgE family stress response membrane protein [Sphingomonadaceae bacterium]